MAKAIVRKKINLRNNDIYYYKKAIVILANPIDNSNQPYSQIQYPYINFRSDSYVKVALPIETKNELWKNTANVLSSYELNNFDIAFTLEFLRVNSNIYKNIFPEEVFNMDYLNKSFANVIASTNDIRQENHGLSVNDFVYFDSTDNRYKKALAEDSTRANVVGLVSNVAGPNVFTLMNSGKVTFDTLDYNDTTILYLSDKTPGKAVHYSEISNTIYIPIAIYIENNIIVSLQQGSIGDVLAPYEKEEQDFENYTEQDLNDIITQVTNGVK